MSHVGRQKELVIVLAPDMGPLSELKTEKIRKGNTLNKIGFTKRTELKTTVNSDFDTRWSFYTSPILTSNTVPLQKLNNKMIFLGNSCSVLQIQSWTNWAGPGRPMGRPYAQCDDLIGRQCIQKSWTCDVFGTTPHYLQSHVFWISYFLLHF